MSSKKENKDFICFVHIEKCGGITLHNLFHKNFLFYVSPDPSYGEYFSVGQLKIINKLFGRNFKGIGGHMVGSFLGYEKVLGNNVFYTSFVREPLSRYISHLNWQKFIMKKKWTIDSFLASEEFNNYQCYRLSGERKFEAAREQILNNFSFIGLMENYDESLLILEKMHGGLHPVYEKSNEKKYEKGKIELSDFSEHQIEQLRKNNEEDLKLYHFLKEDYYPSIREKYQISDNELQKFKDQQRQFRFSSFTLFKRKISNFLVSKLVQRFF